VVRSKSRSFRSFLAVFLEVSSDISEALLTSFYFLHALVHCRSVQRGLTESFTARLADRVRCLGIDLCHMYPRQWMNQWLAAGCPCDDREPNDHDRTTTKNNHNGGGSASSAGSGNNGKRSNVDARDIDGSCSSKSRAAASTLSPSKQRKALQRCLAPWIAVGQTVEVRHCWNIHECCCYIQYKLPSCFLSSFFECSHKLLNLYGIYTRTNYYFMVVHVLSRYGNRVCPSKCVGAMQ